MASVLPLLIEHKSWWLLIVFMSSDLLLFPFVPCYVFSTKPVRGRTDKEELPDGGGGTRGSEPQSLVSLWPSWQSSSYGQ